ncbi:MAG: NnrU protein [Proteobacteria bacterium]|nr:NnrU protein [Pseudomonadota bacterium]MBI3499558.1 NnrU protein [Pseudomonadota bacterium]
MIGTMQALVIAAGVFVLSHSLPATLGVRQRLVTALGEPTYLALYTAVSALALIWLALAYARAPMAPLWSGGSAGRWVPILVMPFASILLVAGYTTPNPTMLGQARSLLTIDANPAPGILSITRHPIFWALALWAFAHIPPTGDLASLVFFLTIGGYALFGMFRIDRKKAETLGAAWGPFAMRSSLMPFLAIYDQRTRVDWRGIGWARVMGGLALYAGLFGAHPWIAGIGVFAP